MDTRTTSVDFYPGGKTKVTAGGGITSGEGEAYNGEQRVPITSIEGLPERFTEGDMKSKIDDICKVLRTGGLALAAILSFPAWGGITVHGTRKDRIYNDGFVVTNVTADLSLLTTNDVCNIVTNEVDEGFTEWKFSGEMGDKVVQMTPFWLDDVWWIEASFSESGGTTLQALETEENTLKLTVSSSWAGVYGVFTRERIAKNALGLATLKDIEKLPTHETVTNVARAVSNSFWDEKNEVLWRMEFRDGEPMFVPVTNENVKATGGVL